MAQWPSFPAEADAVALAAIAGEAVTRAAADALKQDAAGAATDIELAVETAARIAADLLKQDASTAATDAEVAALIATEAATRAAADAGLQPIDADLTAIAALTTTAYGRGLLTLADAASGRSSFGLGTAATQASGAFDVAGAAASAQAASQPVDTDLTAIAALTTTAYGRALLALADAAAGRTALGLGSVDNTPDTGKPVSTAQAAADALAIPLTQKAAASGVPSLDGSSRVVQAPKLHHADHEPGGADAMAVDSAAATGSLRTLGTGASQAAQGSLAAPLASPALTGSPTAPTPSPADNSTKVATTAYVDTAGGLLVPKSLVDAKGDLFVGTADNTVARKAVGANETVPVADSAQADGWRMAVPRITLQHSSIAPTGTISEAGIGRSNSMASNGVLVSGTLRLGAMQVLPKGRAINTLTVCSGATPAGTPLNQWFCLVRVSDLSVLIKTADDTTVAWAANTLKALPTLAAYTPATDEPVYIGVLVVATTVPTLISWGTGAAPISALAPTQNGPSNAGLTNPASLGSTATAPSGFSAVTHWGYTS